MDYSIDIIGDELTEAVTESFENLFFAEVEACDSLDELNPDEAYLLIMVDTYKPFKGSVGLVVPKDYSEEIVMEMMGDDIEQLNDDLISDALSEISNTVVGRFLAKVAEEQEFALGFPSCRSWDPKVDGLERSENSRLYALDLEEQQIYCILNKNIVQN